MGVVAEECVGLSQADFDHFVPLNGFVVVRRDDPAERAGSIILVRPDESDRRLEPSHATVVRLGRRERNEKNGREIPHEVAEGDKVVIAKYAGHDIEIFGSGDRYVLVASADVHLIRAG